MKPEEKSAAWCLGWIALICLLSGYMSWNEQRGQEYVYCCKCECHKK